MITLFHTADVHFGVENYGKIDAKTGIHSRLLDFHGALSSCIDQAIQENIDLFMLCGDAYKTAYPTPTQQKLLAQLLFRLYLANIPVAIMVGNHDHPLSFGKANALDVFGYLPLDGFHVFSKPEARTIQTKSGPVNIVGIPWPTRNTLVANESHRFKDNAEVALYLSARVGDIIQTLAKTLDPVIPNILAGHLTVSKGIFSGSEKCAIFGTDAVFLPSQLAIEPFDYVALGHLHRHQNVNEGGYPAIVYAGSIERIDFGERKEEKGFCRVIIDPTKTGMERCTYEFIKVKTRPMIQIELTLNAESGQTEQVVKKISEYQIEGAIVKIIYHIPIGQTDKVDLLEIQRVCASAQYLAGVVPVHGVVVRQQRTQLKIDMDFKTLLSNYLAAKPEVCDKKEILLTKALALCEQLEIKENEVEIGE